MSSSTGQVQSGGAMVAGGPVTRVRWSRIEPTIFAFWFAGLLDKFAVGIIVTTKPFLAEMSLTGSFAMIGLLTSVVVFSQAVGTFLFGWMTDKLGPRKCGIIGNCGRVVGTLMFALSPNLMFLLIARAVLGLSEGFCWPVSNSLTARWFPMKERARGKSYWMAATAVGPGVSGFLVGTLLQVWSWRGAFFILTAFSVFILLITIFWLRDDPAKDQRVSAGELALIQVKSTLDVKVVKGSSGSKLKTPEYWLAAVAAMGISVGVWAWAAWLPSYFAHVKHMSMNMTKSYLLLAYFFGLVASIIFGRVIDRTQQRGLLGTLSFVVSGLLILIVGFVTAAPGILMLVCVVTIHYGISQPVAHGFIDRISLPRRMGLETGIYNGLGNIMASIGPMFMGFLIGVARGGYQYAFLFLVVICGISATASYLLKRRGY